MGGLALVLGGAACVRAYSPRPRDSADAAQPRVNPWRQNAPPSLFSSALLGLLGWGTWHLAGRTLAPVERIRAACGPVAPPDGLYLLRVGYNSDEK